MTTAIYPHQIVTMRKRLGLTQAALADRVGVTLHAVAKWEAGKASPHPAFAAKLRDLIAEGEAAMRALTDPPDGAATVGGTVRTYDRAIAAWEAERAERLAAGESSATADQILRVLTTTRAELRRVAADD